MPSRNRRIRNLCAALAAATAMLLAACSSSGGGSGGSATGGPNNNAAATVRITTDSFVIGLPMWVAMDQGYFAKQNITVTPGTYQTGVDGIKAVIAGQADIAPALDFGMLSALSPGVKVVGAIASPKAGFNQLAARKPIASPGELAGKKMGYVTGTAQENITRQYVKNQQLTDVELVALPGLFELVGALKSGHVDAGFVWGDGVAQVKADKNLAVIGDDSSVIGAGSQGIYLVAKASWVADNQELLKRVLTAYRDAINYTIANPSQAAAIDAKAVKAQVSAIEPVVAVEGFSFKFTADQAKWLEQERTFLATKGVNNATGELKSYFDLRAMEAVEPGCVTAWSN
ncbi:ABC transporter substrate-binding protein [Dactylosporangium sp. NPDC000244]|uniref:ABC transporter substrate-binding protein n=1 Tax=Dactylosporangium sp. NPDC000244 TaxID=3154365 RepID=UPI0033334ED5